MTKASTAAERPEPTDAANERVLRAAARLFREKGFAATTVREIAAAAGMLPGSLHYRYKSKDEILLALMERGVRATIDAVEEAVEGEPDPIERLRLGIRAHLKLLLSGEDAVYVLLFDWRALEGQARREMVRLRDRYERSGRRCCRRRWPPEGAASTSTPSCSGCSASGR